VKRIFVAIFLWLSLSCAVNAQCWGPMCPSTAPGAQANLNASSDPTVNNDQTQGYSVGSLWQNSSTGRVWIARSVATGAAAWTMLELADYPALNVGPWYLPVGVQIVAGTNANPTAGSIRFFAGYIKERITINSLGVRVATLSAGGNVQAAIYANNPATGRPTGTALASTSSMSTTNVASVNASVSVQLEPGLYWFATNCDNGTATFASVGVTSTFMASAIGSATQANSLGSIAALNGLSVSQSFGSWPDVTSSSFTELVNSNTVPLVQFKIGSVP